MSTMPPTTDLAEFSTEVLKRNSADFDENGNFIFNDELERQWMKLHRDIQAQYRAEQFQAFMVGTVFAGGIVGLGYLFLVQLAAWTN